MRAALGARGLAAEIDEGSAQETVESITNAGGKALAVTADVTDLDGMRALVARAAEVFRRIDVVVITAISLAYGDRKFRHWTQRGS